MQLNIILCCYTSRRAFVFLSVLLFISIYVYTVLFVKSKQKNVTITIAFIYFLKFKKILFGFWCLFGNNLSLNLTRPRVQTTNLGRSLDPYNQVQEQTLGFSLYCEIRPGSVTLGSRSIRGLQLPEVRYKPQIHLAFDAFY